MSASAASAARTTARAEVGAQHQQPPVEPVAEDARRQQEGDHRDVIAMPSSESAAGAFQSS